MKTSATLCALLAGLAARPSLAHDLWLVPPAEASSGVPLELALAVGMDFPTSISALTPERVTVRAHGPDGAARALTPEAGGELVTVARLAPDAKGLWTAAAVTRRNVLSLEAAKFNDYLLHDGLAHVLAQRMDEGTLGEPAVERYSKHVKALFAVDGSNDGPFATPLGLELEIVPLANPLAAQVGGALPVRVLFAGAPLERANVCWDHPGNGEAFSGQTWTDARGETLVPVARPGPMTLRLVHMTRPAGDPDVQWESFWSSLTFHVPR
jgi:hypothetical protein